MPEETFVIAGASLAGAKAAETLREEGFTGSVVLIGAEEDRPYERPPLSKGVLLGRDQPGSAYVHEPGWYAEHQVDLRLGETVTSLDRAGHTVGLAGGTTVGYDKLLIATGASPRHLDVPGGDLNGVHYLRTLADSERLQAALKPGGRVVVVGAGWIGLEAAAASRHYGCEVTVVEPETGALQRSVGPEVGLYFAGLHRRHGVTFAFGEGVTEFNGHGDQVDQVVTSAGRRLPADVVIVGVGVAPNSAFAAQAGLDVSNGIEVGTALRSSDEDIFAAGDVAFFDSPVLRRRIRVEHWANALAGGPAAARSMLGQQVSYDWVPYFFSDQYDLGMECAGLPEPGHYDKVVYRGDREAGEFIAFWLYGGAVVAGMNVNVWDVSDDIQDLIKAGRPVAEARLTDPSVPLPDVLG
jgi:NADPH-dependent 2,4-dienoyl-CoA reductase/sulfur reductase-like enzyme